jgi:RNA polymerase-interacting CarD/CdnL/TRCF family regulator
MAVIGVTQEHVYAVGDWLVHVHYGIGQVIGIEEKNLFDEEKQFYCVRAEENNGIFWIPVEEASENVRVRPIVPKRRLEEALAILRKPPRVMNEENKIRKERIQEARSGGRLLPIARLVRDLSARQSINSLTQIEAKALEFFKKRLVSEWATRMDVPVQSVRLELHEILEESLSQPLRPNA